MADMHQLVKRVLPLPLLLILLVSLLIRLPTLHYGFVWDDEAFLTYWPAIRQPVQIAALIQGNLPIGLRPTVYRPLRSVFYAVSYSIWGLNPFGYHLQGLLIHLVGVIVVYHLIRTLTQQSHPALFAALVFSLHPLNVEPTLFVTSSFDIPGVILVMIALLAYIKYRTDALRFWYRISLISAWAATFINEISFVLPLLIMSYDYMFSPIGQRIGKRASNTFPYLLPIIMYWIVRTLNHLPSSGSYQVPLLVSLKEAIVLIPKYLSLMVWPVALTVNHRLWDGMVSLSPFDRTGLSPLIVEPSISDVLMPLAVILSGIGVIWFFRTKRPLVSFFIAWMIISLLPVTQLIPQSTLFCERYACLALVGYSAMVAILIHQIPMGRFFKYITVISIALVLLFQSLKTQPVWANNKSLWLNAYRHTPDSPAVLIALGNDAYVNSNFTEVVSYLEKVRELNPHLLNQTYRLGHAYEELGAYDKAETAYRQAISVFPQAPEPLMRLGNLYIKMGKQAESTELLNRARYLKSAN